MARRDEDADRRDVGALRTDKLKDR
jgi:hypothetical protein